LSFVRVQEAYVLRLRVRPGTSSGVAEFSEHEADGSELGEGERGSIEVLPVLGQAPAAVKPGDGAFDDPALRERDEAFEPIRAFGDFGFEMRQDAGQGGVKDRPLIGAVGEQLFEVGNWPNNVANKAEPPSRSWTSAGVTMPCRSKP
jgi:hypothetical protein